MQNDLPKLKWGKTSNKPMSNSEKKKVGRSFRKLLSKLESKVPMPRNHPLTQFIVSASTIDNHK
mgnify:CR=1 FL=1